MAVIEIKAATLPGFPYYFPYRTGVRLSANFTALGGKVFASDTSNPLVTSGIESAATLLCPVDAATAVTATLTADSHVVHYVDAATTTTATATVTGLRARPADAAQEITASADAVVSRDKPISSDTLELTATISAEAQLNGKISSTTAGIAAFSAAQTLDAVGSATQGVFVLSDPEQFLDATGSTDTAVSTGRPGEVSRGQDLDTTTLALIAIIAAEANLASDLAANLAVTATSGGTILHTLYLDAALTVTAGTTATVNNIAAALGVTADPTAEVQHEQVSAASLAVSADTLADTFGTRFATGLMGATADASAVIKLDPGFQYTLDLIAALEATGRRTQYLQEVPTTVSAAPSGDVLRNTPASVTLTITATLDADSRVTRYAVTDTVVAATGFADIHRETFATAELTGVAIPTGTGMRTRYLDGPLITSAVPGEPLANLLGLMNTALTGEALIEAFQQGSYAAAGTLPVQATETGLANLTMLIRAVVVDLNAGTSALLNAAQRAQGSLAVLAHLPMLESLRVATVGAALEVLCQQAISEISWVYFLDGQLDVTAAADAMVMYRRYGGDPMWLPFFHAGYGKRTL